ncbi:MAG: hypothetical protein V4555_02330 [Acidobacteriota bacterium]
MSRALPDRAMPDMGLKMVHLPEPLLEFNYGQRMAYPRDGLFLFGPVGSASDVPITRYGVIGTINGLKHFRAWSKKISRFIPKPPRGPRSRLNEPQHVPFPGYSEAFRSEWSVEPNYVIDDIDPAAIEHALYLDNRHLAIHQTVDLYVSRLVRENSRLENPPSFWFVVIPEIVYQLGRPQSSVPKASRIASEISVSKQRASRLRREPSLFAQEAEDAEIYEYATHFRRQLKARLLKEKIVTQIVRETTLAPEAFLSESGKQTRRVEDPATLAWKLCTGAFYKAGGRPWQLADVRKGVCYVGLVYKQNDQSGDDRHACCAAQMFLTDGEGVVFRGALGPWYHTESKQFHLDEAAAKHLIQMVVSEYEQQHGEPPAELFIHATSRFTNEEWAGFQEGCSAKTNLVGVQILDSRDDLKLFRAGAYPVIRGTALIIDEHSAYLWTAGYAPRLDTYMGPETPNPVYVRVQKGNCDLGVVLGDVLGLTKINFNSCLHNDRLPVTIKFANAVGDVLISAPMEGEPRLPFKYYI